MCRNGQRLFDHSAKQMNRKVNGLALYLLVLFTSWILNQFKWRNPGIHVRTTNQIRKISFKPCHSLNSKIDTSGLFRHFMNEMHGRLVKDASINFYLWIRYSSFLNELLIFRWMNRKNLKKSWNELSICRYLYTTVQMKEIRS